MNNLNEYFQQDEFLEKHIGLIKKYAVQYGRYGTQIEDLIQEGIIGLFEAKARFRGGMGAKFSTYAVYFIRGKMLDFIRKENKTGPVGSDFEENEDILYKQNSGNYVFTMEEPAQGLQFPADFPEIEKRVLEMSFAGNHTLREIADALGISRERTRQLKRKAMRRMKINGKLT